MPEKLRDLNMLAIPLDFMPLKAAAPEVAKNSPNMYWKAGQKILCAGNIIANLDNGEKQHDIYSLAALAAGNFGAVSAMAKIIGENEFSLLFHKGKKENIHFNKITTEFLLITIFGNDISLGFLRLKVADSVEQLKTILEPLLSL